MKKILNTLLLLAAPLGLFATDQYTMGWNNPSTTYTITQDGTKVWLTANELAGMSLTVVGTNNLSLTGLTLNYVTKDAYGATTVTSLGDLSTIGQTFTVASVDATDSVEFFIASTDGTRESTTAWLSGAGWVSTSGEYYIQDVNSPNGTVTILINPTAASTPTGQPLPGVMMSLMLGSVVGGYYLRRK